MTLDEMESVVWAICDEENEYVPQILNRLAEKFPEFKIEWRDMGFAWFEAKPGGIECYTAAIEWRVAPRI